MSENGQKPELEPCYEKREFRIRSRSYAYEKQEFRIRSNFHEQSSGAGDVSFLRRIRSPDFTIFIWCLLLGQGPSPWQSILKVGYIVLLLHSSTLDVFITTV